MVLKVVEKGVHKDISIKEGEVRHFSCFSCFGLVMEACVYLLRVWMDEMIANFACECRYSVCQVASPILRSGWRTPSDL